MERDITKYEDCNVFKPGERWRAPRGKHYLVMSCIVNGRATLRLIIGPYWDPTPTLGRLHYEPWDGVKNWVRTAPRKSQP
jgi:hypothetical protein